MKQVERIGRFEVQERLRANPFAIAYRGRDPFDGRRVQIRFCVATDERIRHRFFTAAEKAATLRHPNIATVFEFGSGDGKPYLVQEAFSEESLSDLLARGEPSEDVLKLYYLVQIAKGLQYAHGREVLHRELRPASILVDRGGDVKIADFGTARLASAFAQLGNGAHRWPAVGWLVPELILGLDLDERSDIYGFGALAYELLTGKAPFVAETLAELVPQILESEPRPLGVHWPECPPELDRLVLRCLCRDPGQRFGSMDEVVDELGMIVPVTDPTEVYEDERTLVIEDMNTVYITAPEAPAPAPQTAEPATKPTLEESSIRPADSQRRPRIDWSEVATGLTAAMRRTGTVADRAWRGVVAGLGWTSAFAWAHRGAIGVVAAALVVFALIGWSLGGRSGSRSEVEPLPTVAPVLPIDTVATETGNLVVDAQPWGEILRVTDEAGQEVELGGRRFTPALLELAVGEYRVELSRPELEAIEICYVSVSSEATSACELQLASVGATEFFKQTGWWR